MSSNAVESQNGVGSNSSGGTANSTTKLVKRIPSSFCSSIIKESEYVIANSGARLYNVRLPQGDSVSNASFYVNQLKPSTATTMQPSLTKQARNNNNNANANAVNNAKTLLGLNSSSSQNNVNNNNNYNYNNKVIPIKLVRSDEPTVLVNVVADFSKKFNTTKITTSAGALGTTGQRGPSITNTNNNNHHNNNNNHHHHNNNNNNKMSINVNNNINNNNNNSKNRLISNSKSKTSLFNKATGGAGCGGGGSKQKLVKVASDAPTAMIAPEDYEHIYKASPPSDKFLAAAKKDKKGKGAHAVRSDAPTALIAPDDYEHIYSVDQKQTAGQQVGVTGAACTTATTKPQPSNSKIPCSNELQQLLKNKVSGDNHRVSIRKTQINLISTANNNAEGTGVTTSIANSFNRKNPGGSSSSIRLNANVTKNDAVGAANRRVAGSNPSGIFKSNSRLGMSNKIEMMSAPGGMGTTSGSNAGGGGGGSFLQINDKSTNNLTLPPTGQETGCCLVM